MVKAGLQQQAPIGYVKKDGTEAEYSKPVLKNDEILKITGMESIADFVERQQENWIGHIEIEISLYLSANSEP